MDEQSIIHAINNLNGGGGADDDGLDGWTAEQLRTEVVRLRHELRLAQDTFARLTLDTFGVDAADEPEPHPGRESDAAAAALQGGADLGADRIPVLEVEQNAEAGPSRGKKRKTRDGEDRPHRSKAVPSQRDDATGKRLETKRRPELARAIRTKMRQSMGVGEDDTIPVPSAFEPDGAHTWVPNWPTGMQDPVNSTWVERMCRELIAEAIGGLAWEKVPQADLDPEVVRTAAKTAFHNMAKRYRTDNNPDSAEKREKWAQTRRRWARKDLKQKRRSRAAQDPMFGGPIPAVALHMDYMSSEYSSSGEDSDAPAAAERALPLPGVSRQAARHAQWAEMRATVPDVKPTGSGKGGWADGQAAKTLEVRTPTWRSPALNDLYRRLDRVAADQVAMRTAPSEGGGGGAGAGDARPAGQKAGHVAPSHRRFVMPRGYMRRGKRPRKEGEAWMWATGEVGKWPEPGDDALAQPVGALELTNGSAASHLQTEPALDLSDGQAASHLGDADGDDLATLAGIEHIVPDHLDSTLDWHGGDMGLTFDGLAGV
ncbi:hypothetical protein Q5752_002734 [Cryptotrichosporon argae]